MRKLQGPDLAMVAALTGAVAERTSELLTWLCRRDGGTVCDCCGVALDPYPLKTVHDRGMPCGGVQGALEVLSQAMREAAAAPDPAKP